MELKLFLRASYSSFADLLIVPYGIETNYCTDGQPQQSLLIVPYGIETTEEVENEDGTKDF